MTEIVAFEVLTVVSLGLILGSFLNVVIYRLPRGESLVYPGSRCPACGAPVAWYHNIPVLSWLALGGRCAGCRARISARYPLVETVAAGVLLLVYLRFGLTAPFALFAPFALALVALFAIDLEHQLLPNAITLPGTVLGLVLSPWNPQTTAPDALFGAALGYGALWILARGYERIRGVPGLGGGDLKLAAMIGAFGGVKALVGVVLLASVAGVAFGSVLMALRRADMQTALPFGCFLAPAALLFVLVGGDVLWLGWQSVLLHYVYGYDGGLEPGS